MGEGRPARIPTRQTTELGPMVNWSTIQRLKKGTNTNAKPPRNYPRGALPPKTAISMMRKSHEGVRLLMIFQERKRNLGTFLVNKIPNSTSLGILS